MVKEKTIVYVKEKGKMQSENETIWEYTALADEMDKYKRLGASIVFFNDYVAIFTYEDETFYNVVILSTLNTNGSDD